MACSDIDELFLFVSDLDGVGVVVYVLYKVGLASFTFNERAFHTGGYLRNRFKYSYVLGE